MGDGFTCTQSHNSELNWELAHPEALSLKFCLLIVWRLRERVICVCVCVLCLHTQGLGVCVCVGENWQLLLCVGECKDYFGANFWSAGTASMQHLPHTANPTQQKNVICCLFYRS